MVDEPQIDRQTDISAFNGLMFIMFGRENRRKERQKERRKERKRYRCAERKKVGKK